MGLEAIDDFWWWVVADVDDECDGGSMRVEESKFDDACGGGGGGGGIRACDGVIVSSLLALVGIRGLRERLALELRVWLWEAAIDLKPMPPPLSTTPILMRLFSLSNKSPPVDDAVVVVVVVVDDGAFNFVIVIVDRVALFVDDVVCTYI